MEIAAPLCKVLYIHTAKDNSCYKELIIYTAKEQTRKLRHRESIAKLGQDPRPHDFHSHALFNE